MASPVSSPARTPPVPAPLPDPPRRHTTFRLVPGDLWRTRPDRRWAERSALWRQCDAELRAAHRRPLGGHLAPVHVAVCEHGVRLELACVTAACPPELAGLPARDRDSLLG